MSQEIREKLRELELERPSRLVKLIERLLADEQEKVREKCNEKVEKTWIKFRDAKRKPTVRDLLANLEDAIRQLDLTAPSSTGEKERR